MLYVWPFIVFFSWPLLLPHFFNLRRIRDKLPRLSLSIIVMFLMATAVYFNTIVHPFTLADNRHYMFYVFRILLRHPFIKYAAVPVYYLCAWMVLNALGGLGPVTELDTRPVKEGAVRVSFVWIWLISTAASLVTAPLVEPRYFIIPWLMWRLHVPNETEADTRGMRPKALKGKKEEVKPQRPVLALVASHILWVELAWFLLVNYVTCWMFLYRGFEWVQEPEKVQRFMW
jgi:alpha-1,2-glucosyltransferase